MRDFRRMALSSGVSGFARFMLRRNFRAGAGVLALLAGAVFLAPEIASLAQEPLELARVRGATIVLPPRLMAGHPATLAVFAADGKLAPGVAVSLGNALTVTTDATGRALFTAPAAGTYLLASAAGTMAAALVDPASGSSEPTGPQVPALASLEDRFWFCAAGLQGKADENQVRIAGQPALVVAASPECLVVLPGAKTPPGRADISVAPPGVHWSAAATFVSFEFEPPRPPLLPDKKGSLVVLARGSEEKLAIVVENESPGVMRFARGDAEALRTSGGTRNFAAIPVKAVRAGDFSFRVRLVPPADAESARRYLLAAAPLAETRLGRDAEVIARRLARHPRDIARARAAIEKLIEETGDDDFRALLAAARGAL